MNVQKMLKLGLKALSSGDIDGGAELIQRAAEKSEYNGEIVKVATFALKECGKQDVAFDILSAYLSAGGKDPSIYEIMAMMAIENKLPDIAQKLLIVLIELESEKPQHYVNYCQAVVYQENFDEAIEFLKEVIPLFSDYAPLWNALGSVFAVHLQDFDKGYEFYQEAYRLDPTNFEVVNNLATLRSFESDAVRWFEEAIKLQPDHPSPHIAYSQWLLKRGHLQEGFKHYDYRLFPNQGSNVSVVFQHKRDIWEGQPLTGKTILVMAEQGLGDELLFSLNFPKLIKESGNVIISCDRRLVTIFKRSFPNAEVITYEDKNTGASRIRHFPSHEEDLISKKSNIDYVIPAGSLMKLFWTSVEDIPRINGPHLIADPILVNDIKERLKLKPAPLNIGVSWRSGNTSGLRGNAYFSHKYFNLFREVTNANFINLQYDLNDHEKNGFTRDLAHIEYIEENDLKDDLETTLALISCLDIVLGPATTNQMIALLVDVETYIMSPGGLPWWVFGQDDCEGPVFAPNGVWFKLGSSDKWQKRQKFIDYLKVQ